MLGPEPLKSVSPGAEVFREFPDETKFEADLASLASRFAAQSGGGLSAELSADLALEIVLNEIVEQACLATGATGAAIVLERDGEMACRASSGTTAPELGSRIDTTTGLSGECFKTRKTQWCDDVRSHAHADAEASERLGVRSVVVMPLARGNELLGVIELFSSRPYAFGIRDERTLEVLADRTLNNLEHAERPLELQMANEPATLAPEESAAGASPQAAQVAVAEPEPELKVSAFHDSLLDVSAEEPLSSEAPREEVKNPARTKVDTAAWSLGISALACAILVGVALGRHWAAGSQPHLDSVALAAGSSPESTPGLNAKPAVKRAAVSSPAPMKPKAEVPPGGLMVFQSGKEVFRMAPNGSAESTSAGNEMKRAAAVETENLPAPVAAPVETRVLRRIEPEYPDEARQQNVQGTVVLEVHMGKDGVVQDVQVVSGPALLTDAATQAVKQWRFKPQFVNGRAVEMQTRITLNFRLPK